MALQLKTDTGIGIMANYWRIDKVDYDAIRKTATVVFGLYIDKEKADAGKLALKSHNMLFEDISKEDMDTNAIASLYTLAKQSIKREHMDFGTGEKTAKELNIFIDAIDV